MSGACHITDRMLHAAAECLAACMSDEHLQQGIIFPPIPRIWEVTAMVAAAVVKEAVREDNAEGYREIDAKVLCQLSKDDGALLAYVEEHMWYPEYSPLVFPHST